MSQSIASFTILNNNSLLTGNEQNFCRVQSGTYNTLQGSGEKRDPRVLNPSSVYF